MLKILRIEQWSKNIIIFLPLIFSRNFSFINLGDMFFFFLFFSLTVSGTYIVNDIIDFEQDKVHPTKKFRPLPSGRMELNFAKLYSFIIIFINLTLIFINFNSTFNYVLLYIIFTISYSLKIKYVKYLDILSLTLFFILRLLLGSILFKIEITLLLNLFLITTLTVIGLGKKYSIFLDKHIDQKSKIKQILNKNYSKKEFENLLITFSISSVLIYLFWGIEKLQFLEIKYIYLALSMLGLTMFFYNFFIDSRKAKTENFLSWMYNLKKIFNLTIIFFCTLGILF